MKQLWLAVIAILAVGCRGRDAEPTQPFQFAGTKIVKPGESPRNPSEAPKLVTTLRGDVGPFGVGQKIPCEVTLNVSSERLMPDRIVLELVQDDKIFDGCDAVPYRDAGGGSYVLRGELTAPKKPGRYQVRAVATDAEIVRAGEDSTPTIIPYVTRSPPVDVEVTP